MTQKPPHRSEEEYFSRLEVEKVRKLAEQKRAVVATAEREQLKALHWMRCPKCGLELETVLFKGVQIERCFQCSGVYLDNGELEKLAGSEHRFFDTLLSLFKA